MPGVRVAIGRKGPPCAWPGFMSNVSVWLGPPFIHNKRHDRLRPPAGASAAASALSQSSQGAAQQAAAQQASPKWRPANRRRDILGSAERQVHGSFLSVIPAKLGRVEQHPQHVCQPPGLFARPCRAAALDHHPFFVGAGKTAQCRQVEFVDLPVDGDRRIVSSVCLSRDPIRGRAHRSPGCRS